MLSQYGPYIVG